MHQRYRRGVHRVHHHVGRHRLDLRHLGHRSCLRDRGHLGHRLRTCLASGRGLDGSASLLVMDGFRHPVAQRHRAELRLGEVRPVHLDDHPAEVHRRDRRLGEDRPGLGGSRLDVAYRLVQPGHRVGVELGAPWWKRMGCWPREVRDRLALDLAWCRRHLASERFRLASR